MESENSKQYNQDDILEELLKSCNFQNQKRKLVLDQLWNQEPIINKMKQIELALKKQINQKESNVIIKKIQKMMNEISIDQVEQLIEMVFELLGNKKVENVKYEQRIKKIIIELKEKYKQQVNAKMSQKMKNLKIFSKIIKMFSDNSEMHKLFKNLVEKEIKDNILIASREAKHIFYDEYMDYIDQQMMDQLIMPAMSKLLKRAESNVNLFLEFLSCFTNNKGKQKLNFDSLCSEIVLDIFSYSSPEFKDQQLKSAQIILSNTHSNHQILISNITNKIVTSNQEAKKINYFSLLSNLIKDQPTSQQVLNIILLNISSLTLEEFIPIIDQILSSILQLKDKNNDFKLNFNISIDQLNKITPNKLQAQIVCNVVSKLISFDKSQVEKSIIQEIISRNVFKQLKEVNKLVTNYQLLLSGLNVFIEFEEDSQEIIKLTNQIFEPLIYLNSVKFYEKITQFQCNQWFYFMFKIISKVNYNQFSQQQQFLIANSLINTIMNDNMKYQILLQYFQPAFQNHQLASQFSNVLITGLFISNYYNIIQDFKDYKKQQKINKLSQIINLNQEFIHQESFDGFKLFMYFIALQKNIIKIENKKQQIEFVYNYLFLNVNDNQQLNVFNSLVNINQFQEIFETEKLFCQTNLLNDEIILSVFENNQIVQFQQLFTQLINQQISILQNLGFKFNQIKIKTHIQNFKEIKEEQLKYQKLGTFYDEETLKQKEIIEQKQKLCHFLHIIGQYIKKTFKIQEGKDIFLKRIYKKLIQLIKEDDIFYNLGYQILVEFFENQKEKRRYKYTLSEYVIGMKDKQQQLNQEQNEEINIFLRESNKVIEKIESQEELLFMYEIAEYTVQSEDCEINSKQQSIGIINRIIKKENRLSGKSVDTVLSQANSLSVFKETHVLLQEALNQMECQQQSQYIQYLLNQLLLISDAAQQLFLKMAIQFQGFTNSLDIELKITVCKQADFSQEVQKLASQAVTFIRENNYTIQQIKSLKISELMLNSREHQQYWLQILFNKIKTNSELVQCLFEQSINQIDMKTEDHLFYFIDFLNVFMHEIPEKFKEQCLKILLGNCCETDSQIQQQAVDCGIKYIQIYIQTNTQQLISVVDNYLNSKTISQTVQISAMVLLASCGKYLYTNYSTKMQQISSRIVDILLESQSKNTQLSIAKCLPNMIIFFNNPSQIIISSLQELKDQVKNLQTNRIIGLSYMISSLIKGLGVKQMEEVKLIEQLGELKVHVKLYLIMSLQEILGKLLEPIVDKLLIMIIQGFGENDQKVRSVSLECAKNCMENLSAYGVKRVLPVLLKELEEGSGWRSKIAKIWALGNMAYCSPKQLSNCLPIIVPKLSEQLTDTNPQIREGANQALKVIGSTIKNPEISEIIDILIKSLSDPFYENQKGLNVLLKTTFVHYIDIPALSLVVPIIEYALKSRDSEQKQDGARLIGTITTLIKDSKDILPYLDALLNGLLIALNDPISEIRSLAAKATGVIAKKLTRQNADPLLNRLYSVLDNSESTSIERAGSAQGLAETYGQLGQQYFDNLLPFLIEKQSSSNPRIKEGYLGIFMYLHLVMETGVEYFLQDILDQVVQAISDSDEQVRGLGQRVFKAFIKTYGDRQSDLLLSRVKEGLFSNDYHKRLACCSLLGELIAVLKRNKANSPQFYESLISIYILRGDVQQKVVTEATNVWKAQVDNTPKTLKSQLSNLLMKIGELLMKQEQITLIAQQALEEFSTKYGEAWINEINEILLGFVNSSVSILKTNYDLNMSQQLRGVFETLNVFYAKCQRDTVSKSGQNFIKIVHIFQQQVLKQQSCINSQDKGFIVNIVVQSINTFIERVGNQDYLDQLIRPFLVDLDSQDQEQNIISNLLKLGGKKIRKFIIPFVFQEPLSLERIEIITNNAQDLAKDLYNKHQQTENVISNLYQQLNNSNIEQNIIYCLQLLSVNLDNEKASLFLDNTLEVLREQESEDQKVIQSILEILQFFFNRGDFQIQDQADEVMELFVPILLESKQQQTIELLQSTFKAILTVRSREESFNMIHCLLTNFQCLFNYDYDQDSEDVDVDEDDDDEDNQDKDDNDHKDDNDNNQQEKYAILGLNNKDCLEPYVDILVSSFAFGSVETIEVSIDFFQILCKFSHPQYLNQVIFKLLGPLIRVINYNLENYLKIKLLKLLTKLQSLNLEFTVYNVPLQYSLIKGLRETQDTQLVKLQINALIYVLNQSIQPQKLYQQILQEFIKTRNQNYIVFIYNLIKKNKKYKLDNQQKQSLIQFLQHQDNFNILYKNVKLAREKGKIQGLLFSQNKKEQEIKSFVILLSNQFTNVKNNTDRQEDKLHYQYLFIHEFIGFIYIFEDVNQQQQLIIQIQISLDKKLKEMMEQTIIQLNNRDLIDNLCVQILRALANNEEVTKSYFDLEFMNKLSEKWVDDNLIMESIEKIETLLEE